MIKTILACVSSAESGQPVLDAAGRLAKRFDAHIEVLHVRADPRGLVPYTGEGMDGSMIEEIMEVTEKEGGERAVKAKQAFDAFCSSSGITVADTPTDPPGPTIFWREESGREDEIVAIRGRLFDMIVVGRPVADAALPSPITLEAALLDTGRPTLITPPEIGTEMASHIAVAWESSPEAAHAIAAAMPLLCAAEKVTLLAANPIAPPEIPTRWLPHSHFRHDRHLNMKCVDCHQGADGNVAAATTSSTATQLGTTVRDILMPPIEMCQTCHGASGGSLLKTRARKNCTECHQYHHVDHAKAADGRAL